MGGGSNRFVYNILERPAKVDITCYGYIPYNSGNVTALYLLCILAYLKQKRKVNLITVL
jgi:hypothetical protein